MKRVIRIATRNSRLALWQTDAVASKLRQLGRECEVVPVTSTGDVDLIKPIYELGAQGVFTKELDSALLNNEADIAVHSLKDIPVIVAKELIIAAVLERSVSQDALIYKDKLPDSKRSFTIATSSIRRKAQWLGRYPNHQIKNVRGNVETRIAKFLEFGWDGLLIARAAIDRLNINHVLIANMDWMLSAPAQGAISIVCQENNEEMKSVLQHLNHAKTFHEVMAERQFLHELKGGCSAPISAWAKIDNDVMRFRGAVHSLDGEKSFMVTKEIVSDEWHKTGSDAAKEVLHSAEGRQLLNEIFIKPPVAKINSH